MDAQTTDGEWSVEKVLQVIIINCRSWRGEGMKVKREKRITLLKISRFGVVLGDCCLSSLESCFIRCSLSCASHMNKRVIQRSSLFHTCGS